jgi:beta-lactamase regulating signal transducer with metallopeptidase domain
MSEALINHLWQSTLCVLVAALLTLAFRKNGARVRFYIWLAASVKFLLPFAGFVWIGSRIPWPAPPEAPAGLASAELAMVMDQIVEPAALLTTSLASSPAARAALEAEWNGWTIVLSIWLAGSIVLLCRRVYQWLYVLAIAKASFPLDLEAPIPVRETSSTLEPGVFGIFSPVLLLPAGIAKQLTPAQFDAILAHERCHWQRRDNLTAAIHMLVELLFWFHPLVWWLGGRLIDERERACDEMVIQSGGDRHAYAEGILRVCQRYVEPPVCSAGVSGGTLRKRIEEIMTNPVVRRLPLTKKCLLAAAALFVTAGPLTVGAVGDSGGASGASAMEMKHYRSDQWKFELDVPKQWEVMPPVPTNSPNEVGRFWSLENGSHGLIVFRNLRNLNTTPETMREQTQKVLAESKRGSFTNFVSGETRIGSRRVLTLDFVRTGQDGAVAHCRHYFVIDGTVAYVLGFGSDAPDREGSFELFERAAKSFVFETL